MISRSVGDSLGNPRNEWIRVRMGWTWRASGSTRRILVLKLLCGISSAGGVLKTIIYCSVIIIGGVPMTGAGNSIRIICVTVQIPISNSIRGIGLCVRCVCVMGLRIVCIRTLALVGVSVGAIVCVVAICIVVGLVGRFWIA